MRKTSANVRLSHKTLAFALALGAAAAVAGASWSAQGTGAAKAKAGRLEAVTASPATPSTELFPGGRADTALTLTNPNPVAMAVTSIAGDGPITSDVEECNADSISFMDQSGAWEVAKNAQLTVSLPNSVTMSLNANDACQGATFRIPVAVTASVSGQGGGSDPAPTTTTSTTVPATQLAWTPPSYTFPHTEMGTASAQQTFTLRNVGGPSAQIVTGNMPAFSDWIVDLNNCNGATLAFDQTCVVQVRFRPSSAAPGPRSAVIEARAANASGPWTIATISGTATTSASISSQQSSVNFGSATTGSETPPQVITFFNTGGSDARFVTPSLTGTDASSFVIKSNNCPQTLPGGASCTISVAFRPAHPSNNNAALQLGYSTSSGARTYQVVLSGFGV